MTDQEQQQGRIAAYVRVSSSSQTDGLQRAAIARASQARGDVVSQWYGDRITGATMQRPELEQLRREVRGGGVGRLYVYRLDRLTRTGIRDTFELVDELRRNGCELVTIADGFDFGGPAAEIVLAVLAWAAKTERLAINERISAARARVEETGGRWGRPHAMTDQQEDEVRALRDQGHTHRFIAATLCLPKSSVGRVLSLPHKHGQNGAAK
jgi:putative DNA-invertase from lambdoid prophage Rac